MKKFWKKFWTAFFGILVILMLAGVITLTVIILKAPDIDEIDASPKGYLTTILDGSGNVIDSLADSESNRVFVTLKEIPLNLQDAFIAIEDARFYQHFGIDLRGIARAFSRGVANGFHFSEGASTITQQLLKNNVFTGWTGEDTMWDKVERKIQEQYLAILLERRENKDWILENYLNTINLGGGTRGVQVAATYYFGKPVRELSLAEAALLAGITKNPTTYNPFKHPEESKSRQELVLRAMKDQERISEREYEEALKEDVIGHLDVNHVIQGGKVFNWFEDALLWSVVDDLMDARTISEAEAWNLIYSGGLTIYSTENSTLQAIVDAAVADESYFQQNQQASVVMMDVKTGAVAAMAGGTGVKDASLIFNRATESVRQPGSTIKVIGEYAAGLESNTLTLGTTFDDAPYTYSDGTEIHNSDGIYNGMTSVHSAIVTSSNIVALQAFNKVGMTSVMNTLKKLGITTLTEEDEHEALAIGGTYNGLTNLEMAAAYNTIANHGVYTKPYYYTCVVDHDGNTILSREHSGSQMLSRETASLLTIAMRDVLIRGTGMPAYFEGVDLAGKSGTTNNMRDLWFVGFSPYYTLSIWEGYDDNSPQEDSIYVKQLWKDIMERGHADLKNREDSVFDLQGDLIEKQICSKCGKLAIAGTCDQTVQGDVTTIEYYREGSKSVPTSYCDCHVAVSICNASGHKAGSSCPNNQVTREVYLKNATSGTRDEEFVNPYAYSASCEVHTYHSWWPWGNSDYGNNTDSGNQTDPGSNQSQGNQSGTSSDLFGTGEIKPDTGGNHGGNNNFGGGGTLHNIFPWFH